MFIVPVCRFLLASNPSAVAIVLMRATFAMNHKTLEEGKKTIHNNQPIMGGIRKHKEEEVRSLL